MYSDTTEGRRAEVLRHANMENTFRHREDIVFSFPGERLAHTQTNGGYNKRFHLEKKRARRAVMQIKQVEQIIIGRVCDDKTLMPQKPELMQRRSEPGSQHVPRLLRLRCYYWACDHIKNYVFLHK